MEDPSLSGVKTYKGKEGFFMKIICETSLEDFEAWGGAKDTLNRIIDEDACNDLEAVLDNMYPCGMTDTELNDLLWFEPEWCYEMCGIRSESVIREEIAEAEEELEELEESFRDECENLELETDERDALWINDYEDDANEIKDRIAELKDELENI